MKHKIDHNQFRDHWKGKKSDKYFDKYVPDMQKKDLFARIINSLSDNEDYRKLSYNERLEVIKKVFGDSKEQYSPETLSNEIQSAINIGRKRHGI